MCLHLHHLVFDQRGEHCIRVLNINDNNDYMSFAAIES